MVALKSTEPIRELSAQKRLYLVPKQRIAPLQVTPGHFPAPRRTTNQTLEARVSPLPTWVRSLVRLERTVSVLTLLLGAATLTVYGLSVYSQEKWSLMYDHFQTLERNERELSVASEMLKDKMAERAFYPNTHLVPQNPTNTIFLDPLPQNYSLVSAPVQETVKDSSALPLGY